MIYFSSDLHFGHDRDFIWKARGFNSCEEMNEVLIERWNENIGYEDEVYLLGDIMLGDPKNLNYFRRLRGMIHIIGGNHDSDARIELYKECWSVADFQWALMKKIKGYTFYLSHFPTVTANIEKENMHRCVLNLFGHTHQTTNFYHDYPFMYHVGVDSHNCCPVSLDQVIDEIKYKFQMS